MEGAHLPFEDDPEQCGLDGGGGGGEFVQEEQPPACPHQLHGPLRRRHRHALRRRVVAHDGQPGEVGRLVDAGDHGGQRQAEGAGELCQGRGLADARFTPEQHGQVGRDGQGECFELLIGAGLGGGVPQGGQEVVGEGELGAGVGRSGGEGCGRADGRDRGRQEGAGGHGHHLGGMWERDGSSGCHEGMRHRTRGAGARVGRRGWSAREAGAWPGPAAPLADHGVRGTAIQPGTVTRAGVCRVRGAPAPCGAGSGVHGDQAPAEETVVDASGRGRLQFPPERPVGQEGAGTEESLDHGQRSDDVTVEEPLPDRGQCLRAAVHRVDGP